MYMLQSEQCIACQMPLSSGSSFSIKQNAEAVDRCRSKPLQPIFNSTKPAHQRKETVRILDIAEHGKEDDQQNTMITRS